VTPETCTFAFDRTLHQNSEYSPVLTAVKLFHALSRRPLMKFDEKPDDAQLVQQTTLTAATASGTFDESSTPWPS
jgi:hypothetical protein